MIAQETNDSPQRGKYSDKKGAYSLSTQILNPVINPGDIFKCHLLFSGYGKILTAKLHVLPSNSIFDENESFMYFDMKMNKKNGIVSSYSWGKTKQKFSSEQAVILMTGGLVFQNRDFPSQFFDRNPAKYGICDIVTEYLTPKNGKSYAPITFNLKTLKSIRPGNYSLDLVFTYFNGSEWVSQSKQLNFKIQNLLERRSGLIGWTAGIASFLAILYTFIQLIEYLLHIFN